MRYYDIQISDPDTGKLIREFKSTQRNGLADPGALNIELDFPVTEFGMPYSNNDSSCYLRVWGIPLSEIGQATDYGSRPDVGQPGKHILVRGGMQKGLPLAIPAQQGVLVEGTIFQAFGNWIGVNMTLDMMILPDGGSPLLQERIKNINFSWPAGTPLGQAIEQTLRTAFPGYTISMDVSSKITRNNTETGVYYSITEFARAMRELSRNSYVTKTDYSGVAINLQGKTFTVTDGTTEKTPKEIKFTDLVGQPTWVAPFTIQVTCIMRGDINVFDWIKIPPTPVITSPQSYTNLRQKPTFQGTFRVIQMRHLGNFRQPDGEAWITTLNAIMGTVAVPS